MSAPLTASSSEPLREVSRYGSRAFFSSFKSSLVSPIIPLESTATIDETPYLCSSFMIAVPAAPAPIVTTLQSARFLPVTFIALISPASVTTAVPC